LTCKVTVVFPGGAIGAARIVVGRIDAVVRATPANNVSRRVNFGDSLITHLIRSDASMQRSRGGSACHRTANLAGYFHYCILHGQSINPENVYVKYHLWYNNYAAGE
jgi:hypothetical protein